MKRSVRNVDKKGGENREIFRILVEIRRVFWASFLKNIETVFSKHRRKECSVMNRSHIPPKECKKPKKNRTGRGYCEYCGRNVPLNDAGICTLCKPPHHEKKTTDWRYKELEKNCLFSRQMSRPARD